MVNSKKQFFLNGIYVCEGICVDENQDSIIFDVFSDTIDLKRGDIVEIRELERTDKKGFAQYVDGEIGKYELISTIILSKNILPKDNITDKRETERMFCNESGRINEALVFIKNFSEKDMGFISHSVFDKDKRYKIKTENIIHNIEIKRKSHRDSITGKVYTYGAIILE